MTLFYFANAITAKEIKLNSRALKGGERREGEGERASKREASVRMEWREMRRGERMSSLDLKLVQRKLNGKFDFYLGRQTSVRLKALSGSPDASFIFRLILFNLPANCIGP